jgi:hypothetical protein
LRAAARESVGMIAAAGRLSQHHGELTMPVAILAGDADRRALPSLHSERLHTELPQGTLTLVPGQGHMLRHLAPAVVLRAALGDQAPGSAAHAAVDHLAVNHEAVGHMAVDHDRERWPFASGQAVGA